MGIVKDWMPFVLGFVLVVALTVGAVRGIGWAGDGFASQGHASCQRFADMTGRRVEFIRYNWWTWECLAQARDTDRLPSYRFPLGGR